MTSTSESNYYPIVGRKGSTYDRLSIQDLQKEDKQFSLFILAFLQIQERDESTYSGFLPAPLPGVKQGTFLEIGSIHGKPYKPWAGDGTEEKSDFSYDDPKDTKPVPSRFGGYCNHGSVLFPTWHRPYVLLIEQVIGDRATEIAKIFAAADEEDDDGEWMTAAKQLRFPFWDWAEENVKTDGVPDVLWKQKVKITVSEDRTTTVPNPLAWYPFKEIPSDFTDESSEGQIAYFKEWPKTLRHATSDEKAETSTAKMQTAVKCGADDLRSKVANLFTYDDSLGSAKTWDQFSNHRVQSTGTGGVRIGSLEGVHDRVHDLIGGLGHMGFPDYAGLDPIFFLHHCNVDRLYALWEYCYPNCWMDNGWVDDEHPDELTPWTQSQGTYNQVYNAQLLPQTGLAPFRDKNGNYWTSEEARGLRPATPNDTPKYYSYPEVAGVKVDRAASIEKRKQYRIQLRVYYGLKPEADDEILIPMFRAPVEQLHEGHEALPGYRHWVVAVELLEHAYNGPYSFSLTHKLEGSSEVLLGGVTVFARPDHSQCIACSGRRGQGSIVRGVIIIQPNIVKNVIDYYNLNNKDTNSAILTEHLLSTLHGELADPHGHVLGKTREVPALPALQASEHLSRKLAPLYTRLFSSAVDIQTQSLYDWQDYGDVFPRHAWKLPATT